jgi:cell wall assembly regulator SMI1
MRADTWHRLEADYEGVPAGRGAGPAVSEQEIDAASAELGVTFPADYRAVLSRWGGTMVGSFPIYGLRPVQFMGREWSVIEITRRYRLLGWPGAESWLVISTDGYGNPIAIDEYGMIVRSNHDANFQIEILASDFESFLRCYGLDIAD